MVKHGLTIVYHVITWFYSYGLAWLSMVLPWFSMVIHTSFLRGMPLEINIKPKKNMPVFSDWTDPKFNFALTLKFLLPLRTKCHKMKVISYSDLMFYY